MLGKRIPYKDPSASFTFQAAFRASPTNRKRYRAKGHPCLTPRAIGKGLDFAPFKQTESSAPVKSSLTRFKKSSGKPNLW